MPSVVKPVKSITTMAYGRVDLFFDKKSLQFYADFQGDRLKSRSAEELEHAIHAKLKTLEGLEWRAVLEVREHHDHFGGAPANQVGFSHARFHLARRQDGRWIRADWNKDPADRLIWATEFYANNGTKYPFALPYRERDNIGVLKNHVYLPYDQAVWDALEQINVLLRQLKIRIHDLLYDPEALAQLPARVASTPLLAERVPDAVPL